MEKETNITSGGRHVDGFNDLLNKDKAEITFSTHAKLVKIETSDGKSLLGVLVGKSIAIPLTVTSESDDKLKTIVQSNLLELEAPKDVPLAQVACNMMHVPFNGHLNGFYSDGSAIGGNTIMALHIHPRDHFDTQEDFLNSLTEVYRANNLTVSVIESD